MANLTISATHPVGFANPVTVRALGVLPAFGTWDAAPTEVACAGAWWVRLYFVYRRGAEGGRLHYRYEVSPYSADQAGVEDWFRGTLYVPDTLNPGVDSISNVQREEVAYWSTSANFETFVSPPIHLAGCSERFRLACSEQGANPVGTAHVVAVFYVEG